jgi:Tfp pilus assembly protein PilX
MNATFLERAKDRDRRGAVLGLVLVVVVVFSILGFGLLSQGMMDAVETSKAIASAQAYWAAETGIEQTRALGMRGKVPFEQIPGFALDRNGTNGASSFRVLVTADPFNAFSITQRYEIVSTGTAQGGCPELSQSMQRSRTIGYSSTSS